MDTSESFKKNVFQINEENFESYALEAFEYQFHQNKVYQAYISSLGMTPADISTIEQIPFLPISFWKTHKVMSGNWIAEKTFLSSGTSAQVRSKSHVKELSFYQKVSEHIFEYFYPDLNTTELLALLPSYQEQGNSSLIFMVDSLLSKTAPGSRYYASNESTVLKNKLEDPAHPKILIGVSYALLDLVTEERLRCDNLTIIETGGMKGRRKEITRNELHEKICAGFGVAKVHSEYGMSELMSQAYSIAGDVFETPSWVKVKVRDINDPFGQVNDKSTGGLNIIDLANIDTCCFVETQDLGKRFENGTFQVLGRFDNSDIRGCNLMIT
jgi:hypothetical protein